MIIKNFTLLIVLLLLLAQCDTPIEEMCDHYFLEEISTIDGVTTFHYNADGTLASTMTQRPPLYGQSPPPFGNSFTYEDGKLKWMTGVNSSTFFMREFRYDDVGRLLVAIDYTEDELKKDSLILEYNNLGQIVKQTSYVGPFGFELTGYTIFTYEEDNATERKIYQMNSSLSEPKLLFTEKYIYDNKKKPLPSEYDITTVFNGYPPSINNAVEKTETTPGQEPFTYQINFKYNSAGFPTREKNTISASSTSYKYSCAPVE